MLWPSARWPPVFLAPNRRPVDHRNCLQRRPPAADWRHARGLRAGQRRRMSTRAAIRWVRDPHLRRRHRCASRGASSALVSIGSRCAVKGLCRTAVGLILFCFFLTVWPRLAAAQAGEITGVVVDATGGVLPGATVTLSGGPDIPREVQADARGRFTFTDLSPGAYAVTVSLGGVGAVTVDGIVIAAEPVELPAITLLVVFAEAVVVTATRLEEPLRQVPMSISAVSGANIERRAIGNLTELSRWTPGLTVVDQGARGQQRGHRARPAHGCANRLRAGRQQLQQWRRHLPGRHSARCRPTAARHRAGGGAARTPGHAIRCRNAGGSRTLPAAPTGHGAAHVRGPWRPLRSGPRGRPGLGRRPHLQPAACFRQAGATRLRRPVMRIPGSSTTTTCLRTPGVSEPGAEP